MLFRSVLVLIVSSGALAFVVLYNLSNINVNERMRELATIKVLGFYDKEVSAYIYRENTISSLIGMAIGLVLGIFLQDVYKRQGTYCFQFNRFGTEPDSLPSILL